MEQLWRDCPPLAGGAVAELGCGYGVMRALLRDVDFRVRGCEVSSKAVACCRSEGLDVVEGKAPGIPLPKQSFDLAIAMHVIEHVSDPNSFVQEIVELVYPGGGIVIVSDGIFIKGYSGH